MRTITKKPNYNKYTKKEISFFDHSDLCQEKPIVFFSDCFKRFLKEVFSGYKKSTQQSYEAKFKYFTHSPLFHVKIKKLDAQCIYNWIKWLRQQNTTQNNTRKSFMFELKFLITILNWYRNFIDANFSIPIKKQHKKFCLYKSIPPKRPDYYARPKELREWMKWLKEKRKKPVYWRLAFFMILTGVRISEACGMCWDHIDLEEGTARVLGKIRWDRKTKKPYLENTTKTDASARLLALPDELIQELKKMKKENTNGKLLFTDKQGEALKYNAIQSTFNSGFIALDLPWRSTHILRHSYATIALIATGDLPSVQASLGHTSIRMTERYTKVVSMLNRDIAKKTAKAFNLNNNPKQQPSLIMKNNIIK